MTGFSSRAQQRRLGDRLNEEESESLTREESMTQGLETPQLTLPLLSQRTLSLEGKMTEDEHRRWVEAKRNEDLFSKYVSNPDRTMFLSLLATKTKENSLLNAVSIVRGAENEKKLQRKGNLVDSGGLWITNDEERLRTAKAHLDAEEAKKAGEEEKDRKGDKKKDDKKEAPVAKAVIKEINTPLMDEQVLQMCLKPSHSVHEVCDSLPEDFLEEVVSTSSLPPVTEFDGSTPPMVSPNILIASRSPSMQLVHQSASMSDRRPIPLGGDESRKRGREE
jgi:hypothetical protein